MRGLALLSPLQANFEALWDSARTYFPAGIGALMVLGGVLGGSRETRGPGGRPGHAGDMGRAVAVHQ